MKAKYPKCPKCGGENYIYQRKKRTWICKDCYFRRVNKTAEQLLKENPITGKLKAELKRIEDGKK